MQYISLYRKYRPRKFEDVVGQDVIIKILKNSIVNNKINHAYIFSGPRGTGKTSTAKIFAKAVNCLNPVDGDVCEKCDVCKINSNEEIDILEIDAASNNGVDEIREIRNSIKLLPTELKYKVYIIDEVHMLSTNAFNALLKTLEEPPAHAIFILATTEINKIPLTVLSRCQKFEFKKISNTDIVNRLKYIVKEEKIKISDEIIELIAKLSDGGLRDAINLLDQLTSLNKKDITEADVRKLIGLINEKDIFNMLDSIVSYDIKEVIKNIDSFYEQNYNILDVVNYLENLVKDLLIFNSSKNYFDKEYEDKLFRYSKVDVNKIVELSDILFSLQNELKKNNQKIVAEIYFLRMTLLFNDQKIVIDHQKEEVEEEVIDTVNEEKDEKEVKIEKYTQNEEIVDINNKKITINNVLFGANKDLKTEFLDKYVNVNDYITDKKYNSLANLMIKATPEVVSDKIVLFSFKNNFEVVLFDKNIEDIVKLLKLIYKKKFEIVAISEDEWKEEKNEYIKNIKSGVKYSYIEEKKKGASTRKKTTELESNIENVFGDDFIVED